VANRKWEVILNYKLKKWDTRAQMLLLWFMTAGFCEYDNKLLVAIEKGHF